MVKSNMKKKKSFSLIFISLSNTLPIRNRAFTLVLQFWENYAIGSQYINFWQIRPNISYLRPNLDFQELFDKEDLVIDKEASM